MIAFVKKNKGVKLFCPKCGIENWTWKTNIEVAKQDLIERKKVSESVDKAIKKLIESGY